MPGPAIDAPAIPIEVDLAERIRATVADLNRLVGEASDQGVEVELDTMDASGLGATFKKPIFTARIRKAL